MDCFGGADADAVFVTLKMAHRLLKESRVFVPFFPPQLIEAILINKSR